VTKLWARVGCPTFLTHEVYFTRTAAAERQLSNRLRLHLAEHLSTEAGVGWRASDIREPVPPGLVGLRPVNQRPLHDLLGRNSRQRRPTWVSYSQDHIWRQNQSSSLPRPTKYVCKEPFLHMYKLVNKLSLTSRTFWKHVPRKWKPEDQLMLTNQRDAFGGQSRSAYMVPFC